MSRNQVINMFTAENNVLYGSAIDESHRMTELFCPGLNI